jgi:apolipoprotein N-acyltransferase
MASKSKRIGIACAALILSAAAWFFGTGLRPHWYLTWLAPLPVLLAAPRLPRWTAYTIAFAGFAFGACNSWSYDRIVAPLWLVLVMVLLPALVFAWIVSVHRRFILRGQLLRAAFAVPVLWCAFEYLLEFRSPHSTWGNFGYTQMDFLPILQIASITGIWAISFAVFLFSSAIAALAAPSSKQKPIVALLATVFYVIAFGYGFYRLHSDRQAPRVTAALIATDDLHTLSPIGGGAVSLVRAYAGHIPELTAQGAEVIIVPEKIGRIQGYDLDHADAILEQAARDNHVTILVNFEHQPNLHEARLYSPGGKLEATYEKHHMLPAFESHLLP